MLTMLLSVLASAAMPFSLASAKPDAACAAAVMSGRHASVKAGGTALTYVRCGSGAPTIVFEGGFGGNFDNWQTMFPMVGRFAPLFAYSRPGFKESIAPWAGDKDGMRTSEESARLLHAALAAAKVRPPYMLVGHSLGGLYIQKFAQLYPRDTAGLVLMDNRPATLPKQCRAAGIPECQNNVVSPDWSAALKSTFLGIEPSEAVAPTPEQLGKIPVLVITSGKPEDGLGETFFKMFQNAQLAFAKRLSNGRQIIISNGTHSSLSSAQAPQVVIEIKRFWDQLSR